MSAEIVSINGEIFSPENAKISVFDRGFLFGDGVYEVVRSYNRVFFGMDEHIQRLYRSADRIALEIGLTPEELKKRILEVAEKSGIENAYMRVVVTRGEGAINIDPAAAEKSGTNIVIFLKPIEVPSAQLYQNGMDIIVASIFRNSKKALDPNIKSGNYLNNVMGIAEAKRHQVHDAVFLNKDGFITEGTTWNIYMVDHGAVVSTPDDGDILQGITRKMLKKICNKNGIPWVERLFTADELKHADEAFSSGSVKEVLGIRSVDGVLIGGEARGGKPGPITLRLAQLYKDWVSDFCRNSKSHQK